MLTKQVPAVAVKPEAKANLHGNADKKHLESTTITIE